MEDKQEQNGLISKREKSLPSVSYSFAEEIKSRESWARITISIIITALVAYKIAITDITLDFSNFNFSFTDLLSLTLAIFAIATSIAFYFKATDTSNRFYDNTFKFTKDISIILGRIEAGFGERLRHLDEGYTGLREKFEVRGNTSDELDSKRTELEEDKQKLKQEVAEKESILSNLMEKAKLNDNERKEVFRNLTDKDNEISKLNKELRNLKREIRNSELDEEAQLTNVTTHRLTKYISKLLRNGDINRTLIRRMSVEAIQRRLNLDWDKYSSDFHRDLRLNGYINSDDMFTIEGIKAIKSIEQTLD